MKTPILVIFVDALPYDRAVNIVNTLKADTHLKSIPGVGYSINVKAEMFAGLKPDDVGYFCEWNYNPENSSAWWVKLGIPILEWLSSFNHFIDRVIHKLITLARGERIYAIPYRILPMLKCSGLTAYERNFRAPTFLSEGNFERVLYSEEGVNDKKVFDKASEKLREEKNDRLFVSTAELDGVMHHYGMSCQRYEDQISLIEESAVNLIQEFISIHGDQAKYFLFSDHGMAPVLEPVDFDISHYCGQPSNESYVYVIDATFYRVWINNEDLRTKIIDAFGSINHVGHILTEEERIKYGLVDRRHGDIIFLLNESKQFAPNFFGKEISQAMHGYDPELKSQAGAFVSNTNSGFGGNISSMSIHETIRAFL